MPVFQMSHQHQAVVEVVVSILKTYQAHREVQERLIAQELEASQLEENLLHSAEDIKEEGQKLSLLSMRFKKMVNFLSQKLLKEKLRKGRLVLVYGNTSVT